MVATLSPMTLATIAFDAIERMNRGIALFEKSSEKFPEGAWPNWYSEMDLEALDIHSWQYCATAQYANKMGFYQDFSVGQELLDLDQEDYADHGFNSTSDHMSNINVPFEIETPYPDRNGEWEVSTRFANSVLTELWKREALKRLSV